VTGRLEIFVNERVRAGMQRQITRLAALARHFEMRDAFADVEEILDGLDPTVLSPAAISGKVRLSGRRRGPRRCTFDISPARSG
jgi:hypothetical protein